MAIVLDQQQQRQQHEVFKYYCRICKKGFGCGRALGGHMRAHGINDDLITAIQTDANDDTPPPSGSGECKRMYSLRSNPNRLKTCRVCENCGKEFSSWKSFLEHGRCSSGEDENAGDAEEEDENEEEEEEESMISSPRSDDGKENDVCSGGWSKGKRTRRCKVVSAVGTGPGGGGGGGVSSEEEDLAASCLVMLSAARVDHPVVAVVDAMETEESCASASREEEYRKHPPAASSSVERSRPPLAIPAPVAAKGAGGGGFECKACKRVFNSHQALGGHRASHKKVKGCFAAKLDPTSTPTQSAAVALNFEDPPPPLLAEKDDQEAAAALAAASSMTATLDFTSRMAIVPFDNAPLAVAPLRKKAKVHECTICHRVFTSGQALGGHKRCHWLTTNSSAAVTGGFPQPLTLEPASAATTAIVKLQDLRPMFAKMPEATGIDLNLPLDVVAGGRPEVDAAATLTLELPTDLCLQPLTANIKNNINNTPNNDTNTIKSNKNTKNSDHNNSDHIHTFYNHDLEDEAESKIKLAKLSDLKDVSNGGECSSWLQVGIGTGTNQHTREP